MSVDVKEVASGGEERKNTSTATSTSITKSLAQQALDRSEIDSISMQEFKKHAELEEYLKGQGIVLASSGGGNNHNNDHQQVAAAAGASGGNVNPNAGKTPFVDENEKQLVEAVHSMKAGILEANPSVDKTKLDKFIEGVIEGVKGGKFTSKEQIEEIVEKINAQKKAAQQAAPQQSVQHEQTHASAGAEDGGSNQEVSSENLWKGAKKYVLPAIGVLLADGLFGTNISKSMISSLATAYLGAKVTGVDFKKIMPMVMGFGAFSGMMQGMGGGGVAQAAASKIGAAL